MDSFTYKTKTDNWSLLPVALGLAGIAYTILNEYNLSIRGKTILTYPASAYAVYGFCALLIIFGGMAFLRNRARANADETIQINSDGITFTTIKGIKAQRVLLEFSKVRRLYEKSDQESGESLIFYSSQDAEFHSKNFASLKEYTDFKSLIDKYYSPKT